MRDADHETIVELIPAYALGALDPEEAGAVRQHLATCSGCQDELAVYAAVADSLVLAAPDASPSPSLKDRLMAEVQARPTPDAAARVPRASLGQPIWALLQGLAAWPRWRPVAAIVILALVASNLLLWRQANPPPDQSSSWRRIPLTGTEEAPEATGVIYISEDGQKGTLIVDRLPQLGADQQYQLWLILDGQRASGGVFSVPGDGYLSLRIKSDRPLRDFVAFGITIEPAGGSPGPTGARVLEHNL
jgi:anti-sigma-K factor RskA